jgi:hypothetical protein
VTSHRITPARLADEHASWAAALGHAVADAVTARLRTLDPEILLTVDPATIATACVQSLTTDATTLGLMRRAHRWVVAAHHEGHPAFPRKDTPYAGF